MLVTSLKHWNLKSLQSYDKYLTATTGFQSSQASISKWVAGLYEPSSLSKKLLSTDMGKWQKLVTGLHKLTFLLLRGPETTTPFKLGMRTKTQNTPKQGF